jgi:hypothetical protein
VPKGAGTSVKQLLGLPGRGHPPWQWYASNFPEKWNSYLKFTIVRNPWDRFVSSYVYATTRNSYWHNDQLGLHPDYALLSENSFEECCRIACVQRQSLRHEAWFPQHLWVTRPEDGQQRIMVDHVLRYERLEEDMTALCERLGMPSAELPCINASERRDYRDYYNTRTAAMVAELYATDIKVFGYEF